MAKRTNRPFHDDKTREKIQASQIVNRLIKHIDTNPEDEEFTKHFMQPSQVSAALGLLKKTTPDLAAVEQSIDPGSIDAMSEFLTLIRNTSRGIPASG